jgi:murein DD-endopeptidase MepM/ murein hydrolase activator NlpD
MDRFPLSPDVAYSYERRFDASHHGTDILAPEGAPVLAVERGAAWSDIDPRGGKVVYLQGESGDRYYYAHLSEWALKLISATTQQPWPVEAGDVLGKVGTTGNAAGRPPHIHFQLRRWVYRGDGVPAASEVLDPFAELLEVDPKRVGVARRSGGGGGGKGPLGGEGAVAGLLLLALLWAVGKVRR